MSTATEDTSTDRIETPHETEGFADASAPVPPESGLPPGSKSKPKTKAKTNPKGPPARPGKAARKKSAEPHFATRAGLPQIGKNGSNLVRSLVQPALLLQLVGHPARMGLLMLLNSETSLHVNDLCGRLGEMTQPALSHHLALMRHSGILQADRKGKNVFYSLTAKGAKLALFLSDFKA